MATETFQTGSEESCDRQQVSPEMRANPLAYILRWTQVRPTMPTYASTIAKLAAAAGIGVEVVRFYQRRDIAELTTPETAGP